MALFPLQFTAPPVDIQTDTTRMVPSVTLHGHGTILRMMKVEDTPLQHVVPKDHVEVEVEYCGMNFTDNYLRLGIVRNTHFPVIMGSECCGVITRVGHGAGDLKVGQRVLCLRMMGGLFRRIVHVPRTHCFPVPDSVDLKDAIGLGLNYLVARVCLFDLGGLKHGHVVFVQSIAGGVGTAVIQMVRAAYSYDVDLLGTASASKHEEVLANGVNKVFRHNEDYVQETLKYRPEGVDLIINSNGGPDIEKCFKMLKRGGKLILIGSNCTAIYPRTITWAMLKPTWNPQTVSSALLISKNYTVVGVNIGLLLDTHPEMMRSLVAKIFKMFCEEEMKICIHDILPFEKVADGMTQLCERKNFGKIILDLKRRPATPDEPDASSATAEESQPPADAPTQTSTEYQAHAPADQAETPAPEQEAAAAGPAETKESGEAQPQEAEVKSATEAPTDATLPQ